MGHSPEFHEFRTDFSRVFPSEGREMTALSFLSNMFGRAITKRIYDPTSNKTSRRKFLLTEQTNKAVRFEIGLQKLLRRTGST